MRITAVNNKNTGHNEWPLLCCGHTQLVESSAYEHLLYHLRPIINIKKMLLKNLFLVYHFTLFVLFINFTRRVSISQWINAQYKC